MSPDVLLIPAAGGKAERLRIGDQEIWDAAFSDDGRWLAFNPSPFVDGGGFRIRNLEDPRTIVVSGQPPEDRFESYDLAWAPDEKSLAFVNGDAVFVISIDGTRFRKVGRGSTPTWTPDGEQIVFSSGDNTGRNFGIAVARADGRGLRMLGYGRYPRVSPSGEEIAYSTATGVFVRPFAGGEARLVVPNGFGPVWSPDGKFLAFTRYIECGHAALRRTLRVVLRGCIAVVFALVGAFFIGAVLSADPCDKADAAARAFIIVGLVFVGGAAFSAARTFTQRAWIVWTCALVTPVALGLGLAVVEAWRWAGACSN
jgi:Tol biopolymer transport system component